MPDARPPLAPGTPGLPVLGETLAVLRDPFGFVESRVRRHGPIFRTRLLGREAVVIAGPDAAAKFVDDADVQRAGAMPGNIVTLFGGRSAAGPRRRGAPRPQGDRHGGVLARGAGRGRAAHPAPGARGARALGGGGRDPGRRRDPQARDRDHLRDRCWGWRPGRRSTRSWPTTRSSSRGFSALPIPLPGTAYSRAKRAVRPDPATLARGDLGARTRRRVAAWRRSRPHARGARRRGARSAPRRWRASSTTSCSRGSSSGDGARAPCSSSIAIPRCAPGSPARSRGCRSTWPRAPRGAALPRRRRARGAPDRGRGAAQLRQGAARVRPSRATRSPPAGWCCGRRPPRTPVRRSTPSPSASTPTASRRAGPSTRATPTRSSRTAPARSCAGTSAPATCSRRRCSTCSWSSSCAGTAWTVAPDQDLGYVWTETPPPHKDGLRVTLRRSRRYIVAAVRR